MKKLIFVLLMIVPCTVWGTTITRYVNTGSTSGGNGTTNETTGDNRAYASLSAALSASAQDLTDNGGDTFIVYCSGSTDDTTAVTSLSGWTMGSSGRIRIIGEGIGESGLDTGKYFLNVANDSAIYFAPDTNVYLSIENMQIQSIRSTDGGSGAVGFVSLGSGNSIITITGCIISGGGNENNTGCGITMGNCHSGATPTYNIYNNWIYGFDLLSDADNGCIRSGFSGNTVNAYNNTCDGGYRVIACGAGTVNIKNNIAINQFSVCYYGTFNSSSHNISEDNTSPDTSYRSLSPVFVDEGSNDYRLASNDTTALDEGEDVYSDATLPVTTDIFGGTLSVRNDIGAHEYGASGGGGTPSAYAYPQVILLE